MCSHPELISRSPLDTECSTESTAQPPIVLADLVAARQALPQTSILYPTNRRRLAAIKGHLVEDVKFGGGLLGHLYKGSRFEVRLTEVAPGEWEMTTLLVDMKGKALLFKTIDVQQAESHSDFHRVPDDLTLEEAAGILNRQIVVADSR